jgi:hypothetical protein
VTDIVISSYGEGKNRRFIVWVDGEARACQDEADLLHELINLGTSKEQGEACIDRLKQAKKPMSVRV